VETVAEGEVCGGEFEIICNEDLNCVIPEEGNEADAEGICSAPVEDELIEENITEEVVVEVENADLILACEEAGGEWNECGSSCEEDEICAEVCVPQCEYPETTKESDETAS